jgi:inhibitor of cysteine peptidase
MKFIVLGLGVVLLLGMVGSAGAGLCPKCIGKMYIQNIGVCTNCGGSTASGAFKLCRKCSEKLHQCEHCMAALDAPDDKPPPKTAADEKPEPKTDSLELSADHDGKTVTAMMGKDIVIRLAGNPTTGYTWRVGEITGEAVKSQGDPAYVATKHAQRMVGGGGTFVFKLQAVKPGTSTVKLVYVRPWEKGKPPVKTFSATIEVQEK